MQFKPKTISVAVAGAISASLIASVYVSPSFAQEAKKPDEQKVEQIFVTGTRIKTPGAISNSPISSVSAEEIKLSQPVAVEEFIKLLPAAVPAIGPGTNNGSGGGATIDLRGFGPNRTLVLLDGRRIVPFNLAGTVDTNAIPIALLQRVDLVTGGASAVYGADAITGVVNFVLKKDFRGVDISTSYGGSDKGDALRKRTDLTIGAGFDNGRGNVALSAGFTETQPLRQDKRDIGLSALSSVSGAAQGSGTTVPTAISIVGAIAPLTGTRQIDPATGTIVPVFATYNFNPDNYYQTPLNRKQITALGNYQINNYAELYAQVLYTRSDVSLQLAPSGSFNNVYNVPIGNPYIPDAARAQICAARNIPAAQCVAGSTTEVRMVLGRRFVELGPRLNPYSTKTLQATAGLKGDIINDWTYDAYWTYGESDQTQQRINWGSLSAVQQALRAVTTTACTNTANGCVPLNIFGAAGSITPAMLRFINLSAIQLQNVKQQVGSASASGDLGNNFKSPFANAPISTAFGVEYRKLTAGNQSDAPSQVQGEILGAGAPLPDRTGTFELKEVFTEALIPLVTDVPFVHRLALELGYRNTQFSTTSSKTFGTYKYGGEWEPVQGFRFRGMAQRATRAPNINELFAPQVTGLSNLAIDPCQLDRISSAQANTPGTLSNLCRLTGVPASAIGNLSVPSAGQINNLSGGNPLLGPEEANTRTLGFVWEPKFVRNLSVSVDFYDIKLKKAVSSPSTTDILDGCYNAAFNPSLTFNAACAQVLRSPATGSFNGVDAPGVLTPLSNLGTQRTSGVDLAVNYGLALKDVGLDSKFGKIDFSLTANRVSKYEAQATPTSINRDCLGYYSVACGAPNFKTKFNQRAAWNVSDFVFSYNWRHLSAVKVEPSATTFFPDFSKIGSYDYVDLGAVWNFSKMVRFNLSISNVFNKAAPNVGNTISTTTANSGNTFPQTYDVIGRFYTAGVTVKF